MYMKSLIILLIASALTIGFTSCAQKSPNKPVKAAVAKDLSKYSKATFAAGCFWHEEALFESVKGVVEAVSGYAGGTTQNPSYESVETGNTGHAETVMVYYDPAVVSFATLVKVYFSGQDPTQVNGQGAIASLVMTPAIDPRPVVGLRQRKVELVAPEIDHVNETLVEPVMMSNMHFAEMYEPEGYLDNSAELGALANRIVLEDDSRAPPRYDMFIVRKPLLVASR